MVPECSLVDLVGVGLNATDTLIPVERFPERGSKTEYTGSSVMPGGQVATAVVACQFWGLSTRYVGKLGDDDASRLHQAAFQSAGVESHLIHVPGGISPQSLIIVDSLGERTVLCRRNEAVVLQPHDLKREWIANARALHLDGHDTAAATQAAIWAREAGVPVIADLDETYPGVESLLENVDYLIAARDFPCRLMNEPNLERALQMIAGRFNTNLAAATLGQNGVLAFDGRQLMHRAAYRVPVVDSTGAGDIFHAGFVYGLLRGWPLDRQLDFACAAAAINCMNAGARGGIRPIAEIEELMTVASRYSAGFSTPNSQKH